MDHPRQQIIDILEWRLKTPRVPGVQAQGSDPAVPPAYWTACGVRVYTNRQRPVRPESCPLIIIHQADEKAGDDQDGSGVLNRTVWLNFDVMVAVDDHQDRIGNRVAWEIEQAIWTLARDIRAHWTPRLRRTEAFLTRERQDAESTFGVVRLVYEVEYSTAPGQAEDGDYPFPPLTWPGAPSVQPTYEPQTGDMVPNDPAERPPASGPLPGLYPVPDPSSVTAYGSYVPMIGPDHIDAYVPLLEPPE